MNALTIENLCKIYERRAWLAKPTRKEVLKNVSLAVPKGRVMGLVGESGCGKTTLCKVVLGIEAPTSGNVVINGVSTTGLSKAGWKNLRRQMQVVYQDPYSSLDPRMRVREIVGEPLSIHGLKTDKHAREQFLQELLADVGLEKDALPRYPHEFSGGQRQRIAIARALAVDPQILIADEPVSALDVSVQAQILNLLKDIVRARGLTMLFVTHDFAVARFLCDDIAVMQGGQIVELAAADTLFEHPQHAYTQKLLAAVPRVNGGKNDD